MKRLAPRVLDLPKTGTLAHKHQKIGNWQPTTSTQGRLTCGHLLLESDGARLLLVRAKTASSICCTTPGHVSSCLDVFVCPAGRIACLDMDK